MSKAECTVGGRSRQATRWKRTSSIAMGWIRLYASAGIGSTGDDDARWRSIS
jgi:hypothetical protein